jgi:hypothetical protein
MPPDTEITLRELYRSQQRMESQQADIIRRLDRLHDDFVSQRQFNDHVKQADEKFADLKTLVTSNRPTWWQALPAAMVVLTVLLLIFQQRTGG